MASKASFLVFGLLLATLLLVTVARELAEKTDSKDKMNPEDRGYGGGGYGHPGHGGGGGGYPGHGGGGYPGHGGGGGYPGHGGGGYPGHGGGGGYPGHGGGGYPGHGGGGGYCRWGCCRRGYSGGCQCCSFPEEVPDAEYKAKPGN